MSGYFDDQIMRDIEARLNIVDIVAETIKLTRKGNRFWGLCPFHSEKTPSFTVSPERNMYYCFGCQSGGDMINFIMRRDGLEFKEALQLLAARAGVEVKNAASSRGADKRKRIIELNRLAVEYFQNTLQSPAGREGVFYLEKRSIPREMIEKFSLGFAPDSWNGLSEYLLKKGFKADEMLGAGLVKRSREQQRYYDQFRRRVMFPIAAYNGEVVGFGGRILDEGFPKYLNTGETEVFHKRRNLYGLFQARDSIRQRGEAMVVEGYMDCLRLHQYGIENVVATLGTALTAEQAQLLLRYAQKVLVVYDGDEAGQRQTWRAIEVLGGEGLKVDVLTLPGGQDPDEFLARSGKEEFLHYIQNNRVSHIEYKIIRQMMTQTAQDIDSKAAIIRSVKDDIRSLDSELEKDHYMKLLSRRLALEENVVARELARGKTQTGKVGVSGNKTQVLRDNIIYGNYSNEEKILAAALAFPRVHKRLRTATDGILFVEPVNQTLLELYEETRLLGEYDPALFRQKAEEAGLGAVLGKMVVLGESLNSLPDEEVDDFIYSVKNRGKRPGGNRLHGQLEKARLQGDFSALLGFILNLDTFLHNTQEGGI